MPVMAVLDDLRRHMVVVTLRDRPFGWCPMLDDLMCRLGSASTAAVRSGERCAAESEAGYSCQHKGFQEFVHSAPSLSFFGFMRTFFAAYNRIGKSGFIF
jgi:hypothetical protein